MVYDLPLEEVKVKPHQITTLHLVSALAFIGTGAIIAIYNYTITIWGVLLLLAGLLLAGATILKNKWTISNKVTPVLRIIELIISLAIGILSFTQHWKFPAFIFSALSVAVLFAMYWERTTGGALFIHIDNEGIKLPITSRRRFLAWPEVEQVVLRFGTLTVDCADNRLFQYNITENNADAEILEAYCRAQVEENREKRLKNDW